MSDEKIEITKHIGVPKSDGIIKSISFKETGFAKKFLIKKNYILTLDHRHTLRVIGFSDDGIECIDQKDGKKRILLFNDIANHKIWIMRRGLHEKNFIVNCEFNILRTFKMRVVASDEYEAIEKVKHLSCLRNILTSKKFRNQQRSDKVVSDCKINNAYIEGKFELK